MTESLKRALSAKRAQREASKKKPFAEKLAMLEKLRERHEVIARSRSGAALPKRSGR